MIRTNILVVADELPVVRTCSRTFIRSGHRVETALMPAEALPKLDHIEFDVIFMDLRLASGDGLELLHRLRQESPETSVVILLGPASIGSAIEAMHYGSYEYLPKPFTQEELTAALGKALQQRTMLLQARQARESQAGVEYGELIGTGPAMRDLFRIITRAAPTGNTIFIVGELGTGKQLAARAIHQSSPRRNEPFVVMDAGSNRSVPLTELLFGKISNLPSKSAVTAPVDRRTESGSEWQPGKVEAAGTGTLYIDEIAAFNLEDQAALLEAINQRQYTPLRGRKSRPLSCRIIFGTAQRLDQAVQRGTFLKEFYHNFSIFPIYLPSLSERAEDVPALIYHFLRRYSQRYDREISRVDERLMTRLIARRWALNVRELADCVDKMIVVCDGDTLELRHYQEVMEEGGLEPRLERTPNTTRELIEAKKRLRRIAVAEVERAFVTRALQKSDGNVTLAARRVGMQRRNFQTLMRQHGVKAG